MDHLEAYLEQTKHMSAATKTSYIADISQCIGANTPSSITEEAIISWLQSGNFMAKTKARKIAALHSFFSTLARLGLVESDPTEGLIRPKIVREVKSIPQEDLERILSIIDCSTPAGIRDRAMVYVLFASRLRATRLVSMRLSDVTETASGLSVPGKDSRVFLSGSAASALQSYLEGRARFLHGKASEHLFLTNRGELMTRQGFWKILKRYSKAARVATPIDGIIPEIVMTVPPVCAMKTPAVAERITAFLARHPEVVEGKLLDDVFFEIEWRLTHQVKKATVMPRLSNGRTVKTAVPWERR